MTTIANPPTTPLPYDAPAAAILHAAAAHAAAHTGPDTRMLVADAIGAALGWHRPADVDLHVIPAVIDGGDEPPHPAYGAVMAQLGGTIQDVAWWSAIHTAGQVAAMLDATAAALTPPAVTT